MLWFSDRGSILLLLFLGLLILFLQIDLVTLLYEKGILVRKWNIFIRDSGPALWFIPFCEHGCVPRLKCGVTFARQHHDWRETGKRAVKKVSLHQPLPRENKNVNLFFTVASLQNTHHAWLLTRENEATENSFLFRPQVALWANVLCLVQLLLSSGNRAVFWIVHLVQLSLHCFRSWRSKYVLAHTDWRALRRISVWNFCWEWKWNIKLFTCGKRHFPVTRSGHLALSLSRNCMLYFVQKTAALLLACADLLYCKKYAKLKKGSVWDDR